MVVTWPLTLADLQKRSALAQCSLFGIVAPLAQLVRNLCFAVFFFFFFPEICLPYLPLPASNAENSGPDERKSVDSREVDEFEACALA